MPYIISTEEKKHVLAAIREDGFMISGWCKRRGFDITMLHRVLNNQIGQVTYPSPKADAIVAALIRDGYLPAAQEDVAA